MYVSEMVANLASVMKQSGKRHVNRFLTFFVSLYIGQPESDIISVEIIPLEPLPWQARRR
jgi:hypothetical protein